MSSLQARVEEQFKLCLEFLGPNDVVLNKGNLQVIVECVENVNPSLRIYLKQICLKEKVEQVEEQKLGSKVDLQKVKVEQVKEQKLGLEVDIEKVKIEQVEKQKLGLEINL